jgi:hypothetical protein
MAVVLATEVIECGLLLLERRAWRQRRFLLERAMHALVASILLGMAGLNAFGTDAEPDPPNRQLAQTCQPDRREWRDRCLF